MTTGGGPLTKHCLVAYATRERQYLWSVELPPEATVADALAAARRAAESQAVHLGHELWDAGALGVFGEPRSRSARCEDGERIELYRPLRADPRARRRERVQRERRRPGG